MGMRKTTLPYMPPVYDVRTGRLTEDMDLWAAPMGRGKSHALFAQVCAAVDHIQEEGLRARVLVYCALGRIQEPGEPIPDGVTVTASLDLADAWGDDDGLYTVVRPDVVGDDGRPVVTLRSVLRLCEPGMPTLLFVDEMGVACQSLSRRELDELATYMPTARAGHRGMGVGPTIIRGTCQSPAQVPPSVRSRMTRHWIGPYPSADAGAGIPPPSRLPQVGRDPWGSFYSSATGIVQVVTTYDKSLIRATHGADWGARKGGKL